MKKSRRSRSVPLRRTTLLEARLHARGQSFKQRTFAFAEASAGQVVRGVALRRAAHYRLERLKESRICKKACGWSGRRFAKRQVEAGWSRIRKMRGGKGEARQGFRGLGFKGLSLGTQGGPSRFARQNLKK